MEGMTADPEPLTHGTTTLKLLTALVIDLKTECLRREGWDEVPVAEEFNVLEIAVDVSMYLSTSSSDGIFDIAEPLGLRVAPSDGSQSTRIRRKG